MSKDIIRIMSKSFQALYGDAYLFLHQADKYNNLYMESKNSFPPAGDQKLLSFQRAFSRSCIISSIAAIESLANHILSEKDCLEWKKTDLKNEWFEENSGWKRKKISDWPLIQKIKFIPTICNKDLKPPDYYFNLRSSKFKLLDELIKIRNKIVHGRLIEIKYSIEFSNTGTHPIKDDFADNFWPISGITKDVYKIGYEDAKTCHDIIKWATKRLRYYLKPKLPKVFMLEQNAKLGDKCINLKRETANGVTPEWYMDLKK